MPTLNGFGSVLSDKTHEDDRPIAFPGILSDKVLQLPARLHFHIAHRTSSSSQFALRGQTYPFNGNGAYSILGPDTQLILLTTQLFQQNVLLIKQMDDSSITRHLIAIEIETYSSLTLFHSYIINDWPCKVMQNFCPFWQVKHELSVDGNIIFRGSCVFIPQSLENLFQMNFILPTKASLELRHYHGLMFGGQELIRIYKWK